MIWIVDAKYINGFKVWVKFNNGKQAEIDLEEYIKSQNGIFEPLKQIEHFRTVKFNSDIDTITWANGADIAPERLYEQAF